MTVGEFRKDKGLCEQWASMLRDHALLRLVLDTMEESHPAHYAVNGDNAGDISATRAAIELGTTRGYSLYGDRLRLLSQPAKTVSQTMPDTSYKEEAPSPT